jgi:signal transduction histidine kinase
VDMGEFVRRRAEPLASLIDNAHALLFDVGAGTMTARTDSEYLALALNALVINAAEAMQRPATISIGCRSDLIPPMTALPAGAEGPGGQFVTLTVSDCGQGMSERSAALAFDPGFTTKNTAGNAGLGLWFVNAFAAACGGAVWIRGNTPCGVTMALAVPFLAVAS